MKDAVAIIGSRGYPDLDQVRAFTRSLARKHPETVIYSGGAPGVDTAGEGTGCECGLLVRSYRPKKQSDGRYEVVLWTNDRGGNPLRPGVSCRDVGGVASSFLTFRDAAFARNGYIVSWVAHVVAFWDGTSTGTRDALQRAKALSVPYFVYGPDGLWETERASAAIGRGRSVAPGSALASS